MIQLKIDWTAENLKNYIMFSSFYGNRYVRLSLIAFAACFAAILVTCVVMFCIVGFPVFMILAGVVVVLAAAYLLFFALTIKRNIKKSLAGSSENDPDNVVLTENAILLCRGTEPFGEMSWEKVVKIAFNDRDGAAYISAEGGAVLILEYRNITFGSENSLREMLTLKNAKLPKDA
ncbi:MAG: hypothetical protein NC394_07795 [Bacteroides sp.]|nr:hypothetical protein [Bacteroides sp.]